jgi:nitrite reductase/ring-hydroxylating ferredoxin subunit
VCSGDDLPPKHVFETDLLGLELAIWRDRGGGVNVWENRCPHRGMRLTLGANLGGELRCAYHGYRFAAGGGACTAVPAQPDKAPPRSLCVKTYPVREAGGLVWTRLADDGAVTEPPLAVRVDALALHAVAVNAASSAVGAFLAGHRFRAAQALGTRETAEETCSTAQLDPYSFRSVARSGALCSVVHWFLQPADARCTIVRGILLGPIEAPLRIPALRHHASRLAQLRDACEDGSGGTRP